MKIKSFNCTFAKMENIELRIVTKQLGKNICDLLYCSNVGRPRSGPIVSVAVLEHSFFM